MAVFELLERDGLARRGRLETPHGTIETPALLPVVHPDPARQPVSPTDMRSRLGVKAVITSAYITWRTPPLREIAESRGIHSLLQFDGPIMTDSGAFQQHAYGSVEVGPDEILAFQNAIGSDIATVLDRFTEPETSHEDAEAALARTGPDSSRSPCREGFTTTCARVPPPEPRPWPTSSRSGEWSRCSSSTGSRTWP